MNKEFIPYKQALALKKLGFDEPCFMTYLNGKLDKEIFLFNHSIRSHSTQEFVSAPLYQQAFRWFREKYGLFGAPNVISYEGGRYLWFFDINSIILPLGTDLGETYDYETYEEAELECLKKLIEITKTK